MDYYYCLLLLLLRLHLQLHVSATRRPTGGLRAINPVAAERDQESEGGQTDRTREWPTLLSRMRGMGAGRDGGGGGGRILRGGLKSRKTDRGQGEQQALLQAQKGRKTTTAAASTSPGLSGGGVSTDSAKELTVDFSRDVVAMSLVRYSDDAKGFKQWCPHGGAWEGHLESGAAAGHYDEAHDYSSSKRPPGQLEQCVEGLNVRGPESRQQLEQKRERYAVLFKPFVVKGEDDEVSEKTSTIFEPRYEQEQNLIAESYYTRRKEKSASRPGLVALARDYDAGSHEDVESGVGEVGKGSGPIRCLTTVRDIPHGSKAEVEKAWSKMFEQHFLARKVVELAVSWRKEPSDCLRWRWIPNGHGKYLDAEDMARPYCDLILKLLAIGENYGLRNVFQLRVFLPSDVEKKHGTFCLTMGLDEHWGWWDGMGVATRESFEGHIWNMGVIQGKGSGLWLYPCKLEDEVDQTLNYEYKTWSSTKRAFFKGELRKARVGVVKLERRNFPHAFHHKKIRSGDDVVHSRRKSLGSSAAPEVPAVSGARNETDGSTGKEEEGESPGRRVGADAHRAANRTSSKNDDSQGNRSRTSSKNDDSQGSSGSPGGVSSLSLVLYAALFFAAGTQVGALVVFCCYARSGAGSGSSQAPGGGADASEPAKPEPAEQKRKKEKATGTGHVGAPGSKKGNSRIPPKNKRGLDLHDHHAEGDGVIKATPQKKVTPQRSRTSSDSEGDVFSSTHVLDGAGSPQAPGGEADASEPANKPEPAEQKRKKEKATGTGHVGAPGSKKGKSSGDRKTELEITESGALSFG